MSGPSATALLPILVVLIVDLWVYTDAKTRAERGHPVTLRAGNLRVERPVAWFCGCVVLFIIFFPLYLISRNQGS